ncbi:MAG: hypothetical protein V3S36_10495 [Acidiferrobacterales bacterium]
MTDASDKRQHKPSAKHTLDEVRKSLEDLVRIEFEGPRDAAAPVESGSSAGSEPGTSSSPAPHQGRARRGGHPAHGLDTSELAQSLKDLLGNELADERVANDLEADTGAPPMPDTPASTEVDDEASRDHQQAPAQPDLLADIPELSLPDDVEATPARDETIPDVKPPTPEPTPTGAASSPAHSAGDADVTSAQDTGLDTEAEEFTLEELAAKLAAQEDSLDQPASAAPPATTGEEAAEPDMTGEDAAQLPEPPPAVVDTATRKPERDKTPAGDENDRAAAKPSAGVLEIIELPSMLGKQEVFTFEDPSLGLVIQTRKIDTDSGERVVPKTETTKLDATAGAQRAATIRQGAQSGLVLDEDEISPVDKVAGDDRAILDDVQEISLDAPDWLDAQAQRADSHAAPEGSDFDIEAPSEPVFDSADASSRAEPVLAKSAVLDAFQIPGGNQLSEEITQERPPSASDMEVQEDESMVTASRHETEKEDKLVPSFDAEDTSTDDAESATKTSSEKSAHDETPRRAHQVAAAISHDDAGALSMPGVEFDAQDRSGDAEENAPESEDSGDTAQTPLTLTDGGPLLGSDENQGSPDSDFVELGEASPETPSPRRHEDLTIGDGFDLAADDNKPAPSASEQAGSAEPKPDAKGVAKPSLSARRDATVAPETGLDLAPSRNTRSRMRDTKPRAESHAGAGFGKIPVLDEVVGRPAPTSKRPQPARKPAPTAEPKPESRAAHAKKAAEQKSRKRRKAPRAALGRDPRPRDLAVRVVAKLNMELRKCGERALSPATIDRLQYLLSEALAQKPLNVDPSRGQKNKD